jgi:transketolase
MLEEKGISARVLDMHTIKPLDVEAVTDCLVNIGKVITVEDAYIINGLGSAVSEVCAGMGKGIVKRIGVQDWFGQSGPYDKLLEINGITKEEIVKTAEALLG